MPRKALFIRARTDGPASQPRHLLWTCYVAPVVECFFRRCLFVSTTTRLPVPAIPCRCLDCSPLTRNHCEEYSAMMVLVAGGTMVVPFGDALGPPLELHLLRLLAEDEDEAPDENDDETSELDDELV